MIHVRIRFSAKHSIVVASLLLFIAATAGISIYLQPVVMPPRVVLANSKDFLTVGLGFSPDGRTFAGLSLYIDEKGAASWGGPVRLWDVQTGQERATLLDKHTQIPDIVYSPKGDLLATVDSHENLTLWEGKGGKEWARFQVSKVAGVSRWRPNFAFSPDGQTLAFENRSEATVTLWDLATRRERAVLNGASRPVLFSPDRKTLATAYGQSIRFWDVATGKEKVTTHGPPVQAIYPAFAPAAFSPDGRTFATASRKPTDGNHPLFQVILWNVADGTVIAAWDTEADVHFGLSFSPDRQVLTGHTADLQPPCWNMSDLTLAPPPKWRSGSLTVAPISPNQKTCILPGPAGEIILWDLPGGKIRTVFSPRDSVWLHGAVAFSPDSQALACGFFTAEDDDWLGRLTYGMLSRPRPVPGVPQSSGVKLLDAETGKVFATFEGTHWGEFSPDSKMWAMHGTDGNIAIWDVPAKKGLWLIILWSLFGIFAVAIMYSWLRRARHPQDPALSGPIHESV